MVDVTYREKLLDPRWQKKRLRILDRDNFTCLSCSSTESVLHVHHRYYVQERDPWQYPDFALITLCDDCHENKLDPACFGTGIDPDERVRLSISFWERGMEDFMNIEPTSHRDGIILCEFAIEIFHLKKQGFTASEILGALRRLQETKPELVE